MKRRMNQRAQQSRAAARSAVDVHYSDDCECRNCRRQRRTADALLESLDRHFLVGCPSLSTSQLREHEATGICPECRRRASAEAAQAAARQAV